MIGVGTVDGFLRLSTPANPFLFVNYSLTSLCWAISIQFGGLTEGCSLIGVQWRPGKVLEYRLASGRTPPGKQVSCIVCVSSLMTAGL